MNDFAKWLVLIYVVSIVAVILARFLSLKLGNIFAVIASIAAFTMSALRPNDFPDYQEYAAIFEQASSGDFESAEYWASHGEPGFKIIAYAISLSGLNSIGLMIFMAALSFTLLVITSRIANIRFVYLWFTYFSIFYITRDLAQVRLAIASHLIVISILQRDFFRKMIIGAFASIAFQYFAIIATMSSLISKIKPNLNILMSLILASLLFGSVVRFDHITALIPTKQLENYGGGDHVLAGHTRVILPFLRNFLMTIILYWLLQKKLNIERYRSWIWLAFLSTISYIAFSGVLILAYRFAAYFGAIYPIAFAYLMNEQDCKNRNFLFIFFIVIVYFISGFYINNYVWNL